jgi:hypothetical protein
MTRKDYQLIASALSTAWYNTQAGREDVAYRMADALQADNPRFDRDRFLVAAGVYEKCDYCEGRATSFSSSLKWCAAHRGKGLVAHRRVGASA